MSDRCLVATRKGLFDLVRGGGRWKVRRVSFLGDPLSMVFRDPRDATLYAALNLGHFGAKLQRSTDDGATWSELPPPKYPEKPADDPEDKNPWTLKQIWCLESAGADQPGALWCGTIPGGLFRSRDRGESWELVRSLWDHPLRKQWFGGGADEPGIHSICVDPRSSRHVTLGVSCGGVWETKDAGESWEVRSKGMFADFMPPERREDPAIQDPHRVVQCAARPDSLWAQHHNGVFRSTDGAAFWETIATVKPSVFGFAAAVHPRDPDTAWLVPAVKDETRVPVDGKVVVARTRDGGRTWQTLTNGLPQEHAYDLVYRHALDIDSSGERLAMGSTTGSLWITENQGDSWTEVSSHLPPIYCVRFAG